MASPVIKIKRSSVENNAPTVAQLELGELALNTYDGKLFTEINDGTVSIVEIGGHLQHLAVSGISTFTGNIDANGALDVDGATTLDALTVAESATFSDDVTLTGASYNVVWDKSDDRLEFADNAKASFGSSNDLSIYHSGSHSYIKDSGTGSLLIQGSQVALQSTSGENMIIAQADGLVQLNYDHSKKFETTNTGVNITGGITGAEFLNLSATSPSIDFVDTNHNSDFMLQNANGVFKLYDSTNAADRWTVASDGTFDVNGSLVANNGLDVTGNISVSGTVDGRDLATDGTKLDTIESNATADQTASEILTLLKTVDGAGSGLDADTLDGVAGSSYLTTANYDTHVCHLKSNVNTALVQGASNEFTVDFNLEEHNDSGAFSHSSGVVTVLSTGWYRVYANMVYENSSSSSRNTIRAYVKKNGTEIVSTRTYDYDRGASYGRFSNNKIETMIYLSANDTISICNYAYNEDGNVTIQSEECEFIVNSVSVATTTSNADTVDGLHASSFVRSDADDTSTGVLTLTSSSQYPLKINNSDNGKIVLQGSSNPYIRFKESTTDKAFIQWHSSGYLRLKNEEDSSVLRIKDDLEFSQNDSTFYSVFHEGNLTVGDGGLTQNNFTNTLKTKLDGIEASATADQTAAEIRTLVESASDSNVFTDADHTKLNGIEASATADQTAAEIRTLVDSASDSNVFTDADHSKLDGIESGATADQSASEILTLIKTVDGAGSGLDADTLDGVSSASFLRSDADDTFTGVLSVNGTIGLTGNSLNGNINSTGISTISGFRFPLTDGDEDQALVTDGNGSLSFKTLSGGGSAAGAATTISTGITTATQGQTVFSTPHPHNDGTNTYSTQVFVNGVKQRPQGAGNATKDYTTSSNSTVTFEEGLKVGDEVVSTVYFGHTIDEEYFTATQGQVLFPLSGSLSAQKNFRVFVNGIKQRNGSDYGVAAPVSLVVPCAEGAHVEIVCDNAEDAFVATDQQTNFTPTSTDITEDNMQVYVNGIQLFSGIDYSIGSPSVTFTDASGLTVGDEVDVCIRRTA